MIRVPEMEAFADRFGFRFVAHERGDANRSARVERPFSFIENNFLAHSVPAQDRVMADPDRLAAGLAALHQGGVRYLSFTGGEPLLYPHLLDALTRAQALGIRTLLATNGALLSPYLIDELRRAGLHSLIISLDAASAAVHDRHRGLPGLTSHIREMLPLAKRAGLRPVASITVSRLLDDLDNLVRFLDYLDFERLTFSYPITSLGSSYLGYAPHASVDFSPAELDDLSGRILALKSRSPLTILNSRLALRDLRNQLRRRAPRSPCLAGLVFLRGLDPYRLPVPLPAGNPGSLGGFYPRGSRPGGLRRLHHRVLPGR